jgi:F-box protein, helicase, 18
MIDMDELEEYIDNTGDAQLRMLVEMVKEYGKKIPGYIKKLKECHLDHDDKNKADMIFSTVHRSKGMEYDEVTLADDFITEERIIEMIKAPEPVNTAKLSEEVNLLYVAITRTKSDVHKPKDIVPEPAPQPYTYRSARKKNKGAFAPWTDKEDKRLIQLVQERKSARDLAKIFDGTTGATTARIKKLSHDL